MEDKLKSLKFDNLKFKVQTVKVHKEQSSDLLNVDAYGWVRRSETEGRPFKQTFVLEQHKGRKLITSSHFQYLRNGWETLTKVAAVTKVAAAKPAGKPVVRDVESKKEVENVADNLAGMNVEKVSLLNVGVGKLLILLKFTLDFVLFTIVIKINESSKVAWNDYQWKSKFLFDFLNNFLAVAFLYSFINLLLFLNFFKHDENYK